MTMINTSMMIWSNGKQLISFVSLHDISRRFTPYVIPLMNTLQLCSIYYTVAVSFDRFLYLSYGLLAETICTVRNSLRTIFCITIFSILFILPHWFKYRVEFTPDNHVHLRCKTSIALLSFFDVFFVFFSNKSW